MISNLFSHWKTMADGCTPGHVDTHTHRAFGPINGNGAGPGVDVNKISHIIVDTQSSTLVVAFLVVVVRRALARLVDNLVDTNYFNL